MGVIAYMIHSVPRAVRAAPDACIESTIADILIATSPGLFSMEVAWAGRKRTHGDHSRILGEVMTQGEIRRRLNTERLRRLGAALWFRSGMQLCPLDLDWAVALLGERGDHLLWEELQAAGVLDLKNQVNPRALAQWLGSLAEEEGGKEAPRLVWTLPEMHPAASELGSTYLEAILGTIEAAQQELIMTSPFLQERGIKEILNAVVRALRRGVRLIVLTHAAEDLASQQSLALETIRREAERIGAN